MHRGFTLPQMTSTQQMRVSVDSDLMNDRCLCNQNKSQRILFVLTFVTHRFSLCYTFCSLLTMCQSGISSSSETFLFSVSIKEINVVAKI